MPHTFPKLARHGRQLFQATRFACRITWVDEGRFENRPGRPKAYSTKTLFDPGKTMWD
jgi:hypothetical protein